MEGWVSFHRKIEEWEWYDDANTFRLFFHLVLKANHKDNDWRGIEIKRGQLVTSTQKLSEQLKLTDSKIRTSLNKLKSTGEITIKTTNKNTLITIANYDIYQSDNGRIANKITNKSQTNRKQIATNNNEKNDNNEIIKDIVDYLNLKSSKNFSHKTGQTVTCINARLNDKYILDDFKKVIDIKCKEWLGSEQEKYIRPITLFGNKFEGYINQSPKEKQLTDIEKLLKKGE